MLILSGVSGAGKSFLASSLQRSLGYVVVPSITTRKPRDNDNKDRIFCSKDEFNKLKYSQDIVFCKEVYGNWYAFDLRGIENKKIIFQLKYYYIKKFKSIYENSLSIYIKSSSVNHTKELLLSRNINNQNEHQERMEEIDKELSYIESYPNIVDYIWQNNYTKDSELDFINFVKYLE